MLARRVGGRNEISSCVALEIDPHYVKALQRRAAANERISTWSSLTTAQEGEWKRQQS